MVQHVLAACCWKLLLWLPKGAGPPSLAAHKNAKGQRGISVAMNKGHAQAILVLRKID